MNPLATVKRTLPAIRGSNAGLLWLAAACSIGLTGFLLARAALSMRMSFAGGTAVDYLALASAGRLVHAGNQCLYCVPDLAQAQSQLLGYMPRLSDSFPVSFVNPPIVAWLIQPLALLSLQAGTNAFVTLNIAAMALAAAMLIRYVQPATGRLLAVGLVTALVFSLAADTGILLGQSDGLLLLSGTAAIVALDRGRPTLAGFLLVPLMLKPQLMWLVPIVLIIARQWRMLLGPAIGAVIIAATSVLLIGPAHLGDVVAVLTSHGYQHLDLQSNSIPSLVARPAGSNGAAWVVAFVVAAVACVTTFAFRKRLHANPVSALALGLALSVCLSPHLGDYSLMLLAVPAVVLARTGSRNAESLPLVLALTVAFTVATIINPLAQWGISVVAAILLFGLLAVLVQSSSFRVWRRGPTPEAIAA